VRAGRILKVAAIQAIVVFALLEIALRIYNPLPLRMRGSHLVLPVHRRYVFHHDGSRKLDAVTYHSKNSLGFRGPDPPRDFANRLTIVAVGGSTTEGLFLSDGKTWTDQLARRVSRQRPDAWVNNAGFDGHSTFGHLMLLRDVIVPLKPKVAVFLVGMNDVAIETVNKWDDSIAPSWIPWRQRWNAYETFMHETPWHAEWNFLTEHSEIFAIVESWRRMSRAREAAVIHDEWDLPSRPHLAVDPKAVETAVAGVSAGLEPYANRLREIVSITRSQGILSVFLTQPALIGNETDVDPATGVNLGTILARPGESGVVAWRRLELYNDVTRRVAREAGVTLIDLARMMPKDSRLFYDLGHYTNDGAMRVGDIVADALLPVLGSVR